MDLFRISRKSTRGLLEYIDDLLEGERSLLGDDEEKSVEAPFEARSDVKSLLRTLVQGRNSRQKLTNTFQSFAPFFEAGFLLERSRNGEWQVSSIFLYGKQFQAPDDSIVPFKVPQVPPGGVVRGRSPAVLKAFQLEGITRLRDSDAFLFDVADDKIFLLLSEKPYPWLDELVRDAREVLTKLVSKI